MGKLKLAAIFSDHMVLQMGKQVAVFGEGTTGRNVTVCIDSFEATTKVADGKFLMYLPQMPYGGPFEMKVTDGKDVKKINKESRYALIIGNQGQGMSENIGKLCDEYLYIKMNNNVESLNAAVAASILLYELGSK